MKKFRTVFFKGYQKEEVDGYVEFLTGELEQLKEEIGKLREQGQSDSGYKEQAEQESARVKELEGKLRALQEEEESRRGELEQKVARYEEQLKEREQSFEAVTRVLAIAEQDAKKMDMTARADAEKIVSDARCKADQILGVAKVSAAEETRRAEQEIRKKHEENEKNYMAAKYRLMEYLNALNRTQSQLIETYNRLGELVGRMPIRLDDILSDEPMEILTRMEEDGAKETKEKEAENAGASGSET